MMMRAALALAAFLSGAAVLVYELLASGWMAPHFGSGLDVWAAVLGVTLAALALGYLGGGYLAPRLAGPAALALLLGLAGVAVLGIASWAARTSPGDRPIVHAAALLAAPVLLLAAATPWTVQLWPGASGMASGTVFAVSTAGSVAGALTAGCWAVPELGLWKTAVLTAAMLAVACLGLAVASRRALGPGCVLALAAVWAWNLPEGGRASGLVERKDTWFGRHEVTDDGVTRCLFVNGILQTGRASIRPRAPSARELLESGNALGLLPFLRPAGGRLLLIGVGGGSLAQSLAGAGWEVTGVEVDPEVLAMARRHFDYEGPCTLSDGRAFLRRDPTLRDAIVLDVYRGETLPAHCCTREFFALVRSRLAPGGFLAMNLIGSSEGRDARAVLAAMAGVFPQIVLHAPGGGQALGPMTVLAAEAGLDDPAVAERLRMAGLEPPGAVDLRDLSLASADRLTDDRNPLPRLRREAGQAWREASRRRYARRNGS